MNKKAFTLAEVFSILFAGQRKTTFTLAEVFSTPFAGQRKSAFTLAEVFSTPFAGQRKSAFTLAEVLSTHFAGQRKSAFTLAEVLITLGIIGVVAAMTLPGLIQNYQKVVVETQLKTAYSIISNAFKMAEAEYGTGFDIDNTYRDVGDGNGYSFEFSEAVAEKYFKPYIKTTRSYTKSQNNKFKYRGYKSSYYHHANYSKCYDIVNGMSMCIIASGNIYSTIQFVIYLKSNAKEHIGGKNTFFFTFRKLQKGSYFGYAMLADQYTESRRQEFIDACISSKALVFSYWSTGMACTQLIWNNNLEIPDDYPIKF